MITMYVMLMLYALDANACLTPRGVTPPRGANVEGEAIGACRGGAAAPRWSLPTTAFRMAVACWAWAAFMWLWCPYVIGRWAFSFILCANMLLCFCLNAHFESFSMFSRYILLQLNNHQNSWNWLVINPNTKFGVYMGGFCVGVGGYF
jgi:hypothetical protein